MLSNDNAPQLELNAIATMPSGPDTASTMPASSERPAADRKWMVDVSAAEDVREMTTFELWMAAARGDVTEDALVWRAGISDWTEITKIPELACAFPNEDEEPAPRTSFTRIHVDQRPTTLPPSIWESLGIEPCEAENDTIVEESHSMCHACPVTRPSPTADDADLVSWRSVG